MMSARLSRRNVLKGATTGLIMLCVGSFGGTANVDAQSTGGFIPIAPSSEDKLILPAGYIHTVLLRWGDPLFRDVPDFDAKAQTAAKQARQFGYDCDFVGFMPLPQGSNASDRGLLGVNHENARGSLMHPDWTIGGAKTPEMVAIEIAAHGFSVVEVTRRERGDWTSVKDSVYNRRITGMTPIAIRGPAAGHSLMRTAADLAGAHVLGTLNNCAGAITPWGTLLTGAKL
jgi:uncharacterized protein